MRVGRVRVGAIGELVGIFLSRYFGRDDPFGTRSGSGEIVNRTNSTNFDNYLNMYDLFQEQIQQIPRALSF